MTEFGDFRYDADSRFLYSGQEEVLLPPRVLAVLECLLERPGSVVSKKELLASEGVVFERAATQQMRPWERNPPGR